MRAKFNELGDVVVNLNRRDVCSVLGGKLLFCFCKANRENPRCSSDMPISLGIDETIKYTRMSEVKVKGRTTGYQLYVNKEEISSDNEGFYFTTP